jgi:hypothetical protein
LNLDCEREDEGFEGRIGEVKLRRGVCIEVKKRYK